MYNQLTELDVYSVIMFGGLACSSIIKSICKNVAQD
jgi:hypothetical protein